MKALTKAMCWDLVKISKDKVNGVGIATFKKPSDNECYEKRSVKEPPMCPDSDDPNAAWYFILTDTYILFEVINEFKSHSVLYLNH